MKTGVTTTTRNTWVEITSRHWTWPRKISVHLGDALSELENEHEIQIDLEPLKTAISPEVIVRTHPVFYVYQDSCKEETHGEQLMSDFEGLYGFTVSR